MAVKGPTEGAPKLVTSFSDFQRQYGGYLSEYTHGEYRYLAYSVEQFFANGGTRCYVARVIPDDAKPAKAEKGIIKFEAANAGKWGNRILVNMVSTNRRKLQLVEKVAERVYNAKSAAGFREGDLVEFGGEVNRVEGVFEDTITFEKEFTVDPVDKSLVPKALVYSVEMDVVVRYEADVRRTRM